MTLKLLSLWFRHHRYSSILSSNCGVLCLSHLHTLELTSCLASEPWEGKYQVWVYAAGRTNPYNPRLAAVCVCPADCTLAWWAWTGVWKQALGRPIEWSPDRSQSPWLWKLLPHSSPPCRTKAKENQQLLVGIEARKQFCHLHSPITLYEKEDNLLNIFKLSCRLQARSSHIPPKSLVSQSLAERNNLSHLNYHLFLDTQSPSAKAVIVPFGDWRSKTYVRKFILRTRAAFLQLTLVWLLLSWVLLVTDASIWPLLFRSMIILFLESCSWIRMTFSVPCMSEGTALMHWGQILHSQEDIDFKQNLKKSWFRHRQGWLASWQAAFFCERHCQNTLPWQQNILQGPADILLHHPLKMSSLKAYSDTKILENFCHHKEASYILLDVSKDGLWKNHLSCCQNRCSPRELLPNLQYTTFFT